MTTFHETLLKLFNENGTSFSIDTLYLCTNDRQTTFSQSLWNLKDSIESGNIYGTRERVQEFQTHLLFVRKLLSLQKRFPQFFKVIVSDYNYNFKYSGGILTVGSTFGTFDQLRKDMLYYTRLLRDAEIRCKKHPKHTTIVYR